MAAGVAAPMVEGAVVSIAAARVAAAHTVRRAGADTPTQAEGDITLRRNPMAAATGPMRGPLHGRDMADRVARERDHIRRDRGERAATQRDRMLSLQSLTASGMDSGIRLGLRKQPGRQ